MQMPMARQLEIRSALRAGQASEGVAGLSAAIRGPASG
jgi:hypothetical protein